MKYFFDTEFHEYPKKPLFGKPINTIELISIGIVSEDGREYYAISNEFNLKDAWNSFQTEESDTTKLICGDEETGDVCFFVEELSSVKDWKHKNKGWKTVHKKGDTLKIYWLRENVLKPIFNELCKKKAEGVKFNFDTTDYEATHIILDFTYRNFKRLVKKYGLSNKQIANEIVEFIYGDCDNLMGLSPLELSNTYEVSDKSLIPEFYAYYADYDWVVFCWLFGKMIDLPKGFPMYCNDLKQILNDEAFKYDDDQHSNLNLEGKIEYLKTNSKYPSQENEHNALDDAKWNLELYKFLKTI